MARTAHGTLTPDEVVEVQVSGHNGAVDLINRTQAGEIWARTDGGDPEVEGPDSYVVLGARRLDVSTLDSDNATVRLVSAEALKYSVEAFG